MSRQRAEAFGRRGELIAKWYLRCKGWRILGERIKVRAGEIDLIARRGRTTAFVEVKARKEAATLDLAYDEFRLRRVAAAMEAVGHRYAKPGDDLRIDVILVTPGALPRHLVNVWQPW
jgi:putative endonuclease